VARQPGRVVLQRDDVEDGAHTARLDGRALADPRVLRHVGALVHAEAPEAVVVREAREARDAARPDAQAQGRDARRAQVAARALLDVRHGDDHAVVAAAVEGRDDVAVDVLDGLGREEHALGRRVEAHAHGAVHRARGGQNPRLAREADLEIHDLVHGDVTRVAERVFHLEARDRVGGSLRRHDRARGG
jgi:hypothetical protein